MPVYLIKMSIHNTYDVEADSEEEAIKKMDSFSVWDILDGADFQIRYVQKNEEHQEAQCPQYQSGKTKVMSWKNIWEDLTND